QAQHTQQNKHLAPSSQTSEKLDLMQMLDTLDEEDRALLIMKYAEGYNHDELADMFDLSVSACKMRIHRAVQRLQTRYPDQNFGDPSGEA
ncbi:MAG TPA: sigma factor-like helix-turn-helix DNA-binding protein, partial [Pirellulaceae bacterium]|nr:sigma factor-like helix-turn-helix DNA-binding protein [Pirellulaceae bacterium]